MLFAKVSNAICALKVVDLTHRSSLIILNVSCYPIIKLSILLLYLRIFINSRFRQLCWAGVTFVSCMCVANTLVAIFACRPVAGFYNSNIKATCINDVQFYWATAILNVVTDLYILVLPIPMVWRLQISFKRKLGISAMFMLGGLYVLLKARFCVRNWLTYLQDAHRQYRADRLLP